VNNLPQTRGTRNSHIRPKLNRRNYLRSNRRLDDNATHVARIQIDKYCEDTNGQTWRGYTWTNVARIQMDKCCEDTDGQTLRGYRWTNFARIQMDKCCEDTD